MEKRLKRQKARLIRRVTLILLSVWLAVSAAYVLLRTNSELKSVAGTSNHALSQYVYDLSNYSWEGVAPNRLQLLLHKERVLSGDGTEIADDPDMQLVVTAAHKKAVVADTKGVLDVNFGAAEPDNPDSSWVLFGFLRQQRVRNALTDEQLARISAYFSEQREDGKYYELSCTRFFQSSHTDELIPLELAVVLTRDEQSWIAFDEIIERFTLSPDMTVTDAYLNATVNDGSTYIGDKMHHNVIPLDFIQGKTGGDDILGSLTDEEKKLTGDTQKWVHTGPFQYVYLNTTSTLYSVHDLRDISSAEILTERTDENTVRTIVAERFVLNYARRVNLLTRCGGELLGGTGVLLGFFALIAAVLILMMWRMMREQAAQEQKRVNITNALAHDIKTPLFVISGFAQSLRENINTAKRTRYADKIVKQAQAANDMVHRMLELSRLDSVNLRLHSEPFDLASLAEETLQNYILLPEGKQIVFSRQGDNTVTADKSLMQCVLENLIDNAVKYAPSGADIRVELHNGTLTVSNPCGSLSKADLGDIFEPYQRLDRNTTQNGSGLGLAIVKAILDKHGFEYKTRLNNGSFVFTVSMSRRGD